jgi:siroheme synthase (precorrin-2 oxidase/ferrochelatase)
MSVILQKTLKITKNNKNKNKYLRKKVHMRRKMWADIMTKYRNKNQKKKVKKRRTLLFMILILNRRKRWD